MSDAYERLAKKLDELPHGYPATESGVEIKILKKIFSHEEAEMALKMRPIPENVEAIAQRLGKPLPEMQAILDTMVQKGQLGSIGAGGVQSYALFPFIIGIWEFQMNRLDKELAELFHEYYPHLAEVLGKYAPSVTRVIPIQSQIKAEQRVLLYEDVRRMFEQAKSFQLMNCICRKEQALLGKPCKHSSEVCMGFSREEGAFDKYPFGRIISREEALSVISRAEEEGLVHLTYNLQGDSFFLCNCCSCCCLMLRAAKNFNAPYLLAKSYYVASIDQETCAACGTCAEERCPMEAVVEDNGGYKVQPERCIGCGVCTNTCPTESITLGRRPESEREEPAENIFDWYFKRAQNRGVQLKVD
jgi:Na+-translocating ferredoxin:NAD+ oxidoreductase subunit B